ncbi:putative ferritin-1 [Pirellulimonas nuda]|uniref:Ferritin n=1 Tax=Pirellulimonas nuda TaxID=2528009 RepID=A0A518DIZ3_9BACT|nr:ferritin [Pirellulimonas nuda]QDU91402.1 putative ferritin-1 [Pirellulimonas nuda]
MPSLSDVMQDAINEQIGNELHASYSYLAMSAWLSHQEFHGSAAWMRAQSQEENAHAMKLYDFLVARGGRVNLRPITQPNQEFKSVADVFNSALAQEQGVTVQIEKLYELAFHEKAFAALVELEWFIREQVEEEKTLREIVHKFKLIGDDGASLLDLDRELAGRQPEAPSAE